MKGVIEIQRVVGPDDFWKNRLWIPSPTELIEGKCFLNCERLRWAVFENGLRLMQIEESAFRLSELHDIVISSPVEMIGLFCFLGCSSIISMTFESQSKLVRIEQSAF
jgi:hypothetical protein